MAKHNAVTTLDLSITVRAVASLVLVIVATALNGHSLSAADRDSGTFTVVPFVFDPFGTRLVNAEWEGGIGCPTNATIRPFLAPDFSTLGPPTPYQETGCPTGDPRDDRNQGLLLAKTGPTNNDASAGATIQGVKNLVLTELGYDIRKPAAFADPRGSHCGAGAPRFNVVTQDGETHFIGCASPPPLQTTTGFWIRLRWTPAQALPPITSPVRSIEIVFDEGQDTGPDNFGLAVLDNIDINGTLVGRGPSGPADNDRDEGRGEDHDHRSYEFHDSQSRPETSSLSFNDPNEAANVQSINGARAISYNGACVSFVSDAAWNAEPGYVVSFASCDLSALPTLVPGAQPQIGNYTIAVSGPTGVVYQKAGDLISGGVSIHK
jgi:hypothetical protein